MVGKTTKPAKTTRPAKAAPPPRAPKPVPTGWWRGLGQPHKRQNLVRVALALVILAFAAKLVEVQVVDAQALAIQGQNSRLRVEVEPAQRGSIVSADGTVLAADVVRYEVQANQVEVAGWVHRDTAGNRLGEGAAEAAKLLAPLLGVAEDEALAKLDGTETYVRLIKEADQATWDEIKAL
ncbi:MAG: hypothetical protein LBR19_07795, partial [Bifidobacteriaceae bacterium]|nr:hypothetical protein [Bifidobacteriaceae bacterium]